MYNWYNIVYTISVYVQKKDTFITHKCSWERTEWNRKEDRERERERERESDEIKWDEINIVK